MIPSVITQDNLQSYNRAVNAINQNQRNNIRKLNIALDQANAANSSIAAAYTNLSNVIKELKGKVFINQALCDNFDICVIYGCGNSQSADYGHGVGLTSPIKFRMDILA